MSRLHHHLGCILIYYLFPNAISTDKTHFVVCFKNTQQPASHLSYHWFTSALCISECTATRKKTKALASILKTHSNVGLDCITMCLHLCVSKRMVTCNKKCTLCHAFQKWAAMWFTLVLLFRLPYHLHVSKCTQDRKQTLCVSKTHSKARCACVSILSHLHVYKRCGSPHNKNMHYAANF